MLQFHSKAMGYGPTITTPSPLLTAEAGFLYSTQLSGIGGTQPYTFAIVSGSTPFNLSPAGILSGLTFTPQVDTFGIQITDAANAVSPVKLFSLTIVSQLAITTASLPAATQGVPYSATMAASGGVTPYVWSSLFSSTLAGLGLTLNASTGAITGTPNQAGTFTPNCTVTDALGNFVATPVGITVASNLAITTASPLSGATAGSPYSAPLAASGGTPGYTWALVSSTGTNTYAVSSSGVVTGTPATAETDTITVSVTDVLSTTVQKTFSVTVAVATLQSLGVNLDSIGYASPALPFLNIMKQGGEFQGTGSTPAYNWFTKTAGGAGTAEEGLLNLDSDGYPLQIPQPGLTGTQLETLLSYTVPVAPGQTLPYGFAGITYRVKYSGAGTIVISGDVNATITASGQTFTVPTPGSGSGLKATITASTLGNHITNMSVVETGQTTNYDAGAIFHPGFLTPLKANIACIRFMDWLKTNNGCVHLTFTAAIGATATSAILAGNWPLPTGAYAYTFSDGERRTLNLTHGATTCNWTSGLTNAVAADAYGNWITYATRKLPSNAFYGESDIGGCPYEICIALSNAANADCYINVPLFFSDADISSLASLVASTLNSNLNAYFELSNEIWNGGLGPSYQAAVYAGKGYFTGLSSDYEYNRAFTGMRTAQMAALCLTAFAGQTARCIPLLGGQAAGTYSVTDALAYAVSHGEGTANIKAIAIAPYFPANAGPYDMSATDAANIKAQADGGINYLSQLLTSNVVTGGTAPGTYASVPAVGYLGVALSYIDNYAAIKNTSLAGKNLICYECGQQYQGFDPTASPLGNTLTYAFNRSAAMNTAYATLFSHWKSAIGGGRLNVMNHFNFSSASAGGYSWGLIEGSLQTLTPLTSAPQKWQAFKAATG